MSGNLRWHGAVIEVNGDMFTAEITGGHGVPSLTADFSMTECGLSGIEPGDVIVVTPSSVERVDLGVWTQQQLDDIREKAREQYDLIMRYTE